MSNFRHDDALWNWRYIGTSLNYNIWIHTWFPLQYEYLCRLEVFCYCLQDVLQRYFIARWEGDAPLLEVFLHPDMEPVDYITVCEKYQWYGISFIFANFCSVYECQDVLAVILGVIYLCCAFWWWCCFFHFTSVIFAHYCWWYYQLWFWVDRDVTRRIVE